MPNEQATLEKESPYRLPDFALPVSYDIRLAPDLETFKCPGSEVIELDIRRPTDHILLNALELEIDSAEISFGANNEKIKAEVHLEPETDRAKFSFGKTIPAGKAHLEIKFSATINDKLRGFYRSSQTLPSGEKSWIALTQFEATDARRAFPCFDEPAFKATFKLTMEVAPELTAISNTKVESQTVDAKTGKKVFNFGRTMKMATYIVAFVVGQFEETKAVDVDGIPFKIYAPIGKLALTPFSLEIGASALAFFNKYYGIKYPGDKMDMIAVPDFAFGAMENLGCVIYRENALLVDPLKASQSEKERVADVVAHELAHMWFGNLTTMKWWNGIWLNEAFATFMALVAVEAWKPEWKRFETFGVSRAMAFATDGLKATRAIEFPVSKPEEANGMFDILTYEKGASVLRMLEQYIGADTFKAGVNAYLNKHKFSNTETDDLWESLAAASSEPVEDIMNSWIFQEGHPLVAVELSADKKTLMLKQERFYYLPESPKEQLFQIPLLLRAKTAKTVIEKKVLLKTKEMKVPLDSHDEIEWVVVNAGGHGFYRVAYSEALLKTLSGILPSLTVLERFNLVSDLWALTVNGTVKLTQFLDFVKLFKNEQDKNVWAVILSALQYLDRVFYLDTKRLAAYTRDLLAPSFQRLGWAASDSSEDALTKQLRGSVILTLGTVGQDQAVIDQAKELYGKHLAGEGQALEPDVLGAIISILAFVGDEKRYNEFEKAFTAAPSPQEQERYMYALAAFKEEALLKRTLAKTLNGEIRSQSAPFVVRGVMLNPWGRAVGWQFVQDNWEKARTVFPSQIITRMIEGITGLVDAKMAAEVFAFFAQHPVNEGQKTTDQHLEKLKVALAFMERERVCAPS
ncbi:MAG: M1 family metallopeptidase [Cyanobacteria bacterium SZAS LIN-2]|nr:M1 family metallopeptidase [Cyanobacteria bacterium SZAS LIN-2]